MAKASIPILGYKAKFPNEEFGLAVEYSEDEIKISKVPIEEATSFKQKKDATRARVVWQTFNKGVTLETTPELDMSGTIAKKEEAQV